MRDVRRPFLETLFDWDSEPTNRAAGTLFQPKGLGTVLPGRELRRQNVSRHLITFVIAGFAASAGAVAVLAFSRYLHLGPF